MTYAVLFLGFAVIFVLVPIFFLVVGLDHARAFYRQLGQLGPKYYVTREYWMEGGKLALRVFCWLMGAIIYAIIAVRFLR